jgi:hypothetical protein
MFARILARQIPCGRDERSGVIPASRPNRTERRVSNRPVARARKPIDWLLLTYDQAAAWLHQTTPDGNPPPLVEHAEQAGRYAALAIGSLDRDAPSVPEAIADCLAHLLFICIFVDTVDAAGVSN